MQELLEKVDPSLFRSRDSEQAAELVSNTFSHSMVDDQLAECIEVLWAEGCIKKEFHEQVRPALE